MNEENITPEQMPVAPIKPKNNKLIIIVVGILVILIIIALAYLLGSKKSNTTTVAETSPTIESTVSASSGTEPGAPALFSATVTAATVSTATGQTYSNDDFGFSLVYPKTETARVINGATETVAFEITPNSGDGQSISFYHSDQSLETIVSGARTDMPSGYSVSEFSETIGGEPATELMITKQSDSSQNLNIYVKHNSNIYEIIGASSDQTIPTLIQSLQFTK